MRSIAVTSANLELKLDTEYLRRTIISKDLKNDSNFMLRRHTIHINAESLSAPKIVSIERKKCPQVCELRSIPENDNHPAQTDNVCESDNSDFLDSNFKSDVKSKINFFNKMAYENDRTSPSIPRRRLSGRNDSNSSFPRPKSECRDYRVSKFSLESVHTVDSRQIYIPKVVSVKHSKQKFDQSSLSKDRKVKPLSNPIQLPFSAVPVKLRIAAIEKKCFIN